MDKNLREEFEYYIARHEVGKDMNLAETQCAVIDVIKYLLFMEEKENGKDNSDCGR